MSDLKVETIKFDIINYYGSWKVFQDFDKLVVIYKDMKENFDFRNSESNLAIAKETSFKAYWKQMMKDLNLNRINDCLEDEEDDINRELFLMKKYFMYADYILEYNLPLNKLFRQPYSFDSDYLEIVKAEEEKFSNCLKRIGEYLKYISSIAEDVSALLNKRNKATDERFSKFFWLGDNMEKFVTYQFNS